jgi:hypothetical protein
MTINDAMRKYRLPNPTTPEDLECRWSKTLRFGDKVVMAGYYYNGQNKPCYFGAAYEFLDDGEHLRKHHRTGGGQRESSLKMKATRSSGR